MFRLCLGFLVCAQVAWAAAPTISNRDPATGYACLMEKRLVEQVELGAARTPFLRFGDTVRIEMRDAEGRSIFGAIEQRVERYK